MSELYDRLEEVLMMNKVQIKTNSGITKSQKEMKALISLLLIKVYLNF